MKPGWIVFLFAWISGLAVAPLAACLVFDEDYDMVIFFAVASVASFLFAAHVAKTLMGEDQAVSDLPRYWKPLVKLRPDDMFTRIEVVRETIARRSTVAAGALGHRQRRHGAGAQGDRLRCGGRTGDRMAVNSSGRLRRGWARLGMVWSGAARQGRLKRLDASQIWFLR